MSYFVAHEGAEQRAVLFCSPNLVLAMLVASSLDAWRIRVDVAPALAGALELLELGTHYCLVVVDRHDSRGIARLRAHRLVDAQMVIEIDGVDDDHGSVAHAITVAERQAELLAPTILEYLQTPASAMVIH